MSKKITLKEFFESKEKLAIHCDTEEKANKLLKEFDKLGKKWWAGESYLEFNNFNMHKHKTCYSNDGAYDEIEFYKDENYKIYSLEDIIFEEKPKNLIPLIARELGIEIGETFEVYDWEQDFMGTYYLTEGGLFKNKEREKLNMDNSCVLNDILVGSYTIKKLPKAPQLSEQEYWVLKGLKDYKYLIRDIVGDMNVQKNVSVNIYDDWDYMCPYNHLFKFVEKDQEPHNIQELIKEYEEFNESN